MMRNDYRRSLIMLRSHEQGYSGHVRLESRTLMGSMYFMINVPPGSGALCAALIRRDARGNYFSTKIGDLRRDGRGQASLAYTFDPRNIDGHPLEEYQLIGIVHRNANGCALVLSGNVNGSREVDWNSVCASACDVCQERREPACDLCPPQIVVPLPPNRPAAPGEGPLGPQMPVVPPLDQPASPGEGPVELPTPELPPLDQPASPGEGPLELPTPELSAVDAGMPAMAALGLDASAPWPGVSEQLREAFTKQPARELMLEDGHTYVRMPMPEGSGYEYVYVGVHAESGAPVSVAYALPARYTPEPPPGLEEYAWKGGASEGWWTLLTDARTGAPMV